MPAVDADGIRNQAAPYRLAAFLARPALAPGLVPVALVHTAGTAACYNTATAEGVAVVDVVVCSKAAEPVAAAGSHRNTPLLRILAEEYPRR